MLQENTLAQALIRYTAEHLIAKYPEHLRGATAVAT